MTLDELLDSKSTSHEWSQSCVNLQIGLPGAHNTGLFEGVCVGELRVPSKQRGGKRLAWS